MEQNNIYKIGDPTNEIIFEGKTLTFEYPISKVLEVSHMLIVLLRVPPKIKYNRNVFGVSLIEKNIKWQIKFQNLKTLFNESCPFTNIFIYDNKLRLNNWCSFALFVNPLTGEVLEELETR